METLNTQVFPEKKLSLIPEDASFLGEKYLIGGGKRSKGRFIYCLRKGEDSGIYRTSLDTGKEAKH